MIVIAGGDGSLITTLRAAQDAGVDISKLSSCVLPFGTGNDFARVTNWGGDTRGAIYQTVDALAKELCENTEVKEINVWHVSVKFRNGGDVFEVNSKTK